MPADVIATVESFAPADAVREPVFKNRNGRLDWETDVDDTDEYHDAQECVPLEEQDIPLRPDAAITAAELHELAADATAHGEIPGVNTDDENTEAPSNDEEPEISDAKEPEIPGVQDAIPGVQDANPGVQDTIPGVQEKKEQEQEEEEIVFETNSEYEPSINNTSNVTSEDVPPKSMTTPPKTALAPMKKDATKQLHDRGAGYALKGICLITINLLGRLSPRMHTHQACKLHLETMPQTITKNG
jgi:hypothetical protein